DDEGAHQGDEHAEQPCVAVHAQVEIYGQPARDPGGGELDDLAFGDGRVVQGREDGAREGDGARKPGLYITRIGRQRDGDQAAYERQYEDEDQRHSAWGGLKEKTALMIRYFSMCSARCLIIDLP